MGTHAGARPGLRAGVPAFLGRPWRKGHLEPKVKEFCYIAFDASATHMFQPGLKLHIRDAVRLGAAAHEIMEVLEVASVIGVHACAVAAPILADELRGTGASQ